MGTGGSSEDLSKDQQALCPRLSLSSLSPSALGLGLKPRGGQLRVLHNAAGRHCLRLAGWPSCLVALWEVKAPLQPVSPSAKGTFNLCLLNRMGDGVCRVR